MTARSRSVRCAAAAASFLIGLGIVGLTSVPAYAATVGDTGALNAAILADDPVIEITGDFTLGADIETIDYDVEIVGNGFTIDANGYDAFDIEASAVTISNLTVVDPASEAFELNLNDGGSATLTNVSTADSEYGVDIGSAADLTVQITGGAHTDNYAGIYVDYTYGDSTVTITDVAMDSVDYGVYLYEAGDDSTTTVSGANMVDAYYGIYIDYLYEDAAVAIVNSTFNGSYYAISGYEFYDNSSLEVSGVTITAGSLTGGGGGGGVYLEYLYDASSATLTETSVSGDINGDYYYLPIWAGQYGNSVLIADDVTLSGNGYGFYIDSYEPGTSTEIRNSSVIGNTNNGIYVCDLYGTLLVDSTTVDSNGIDSYYTGVYIDYAYEGSEIVISRSTISNNGYGGILYDNDYGDNSFTLVNSTISGNDGQDEIAAVFIYSDNYEDQEIALLNNTITDNINVWAGLQIEGTEFVTVSHSIVSGNDTNEAEFVIDDQSDAFIEWSILGTSLVDGSSDPADLAPMLGAGVIVSSNPGLGPLANNGGPTLTHSLLASSVALNAGNPAIAGAPATDQRGNARIVGSAIDIGALEAPAMLAATGAEPTGLLGAAAILLLLGTGIVATRRMRQPAAG